jgi:hypothetical protein
MRQHAADRPLEDTISEHDRKLPPNPRATGDPSNPQGWFWHPEEAHREEDFQNLAVPELEEHSNEPADARAPGAIAGNRWDEKARSPDPDDLSSEHLPRRGQ